MLIYSNIPELQEVSTGLHTVNFKDNKAEVSDEVAAHLFGLFPGQFQLKPETKSKKDTE